MRTCKRCGKELRQEQKTYCSRSCRNKDNPRQFVETATIPKTCLICGKDFLAKRKDRKYCSDQCNWKARQQRAPKRVRPDQTYWRKHRHEVLETQEGKCWLCLKEIGSDSGFNVHHLKGDHDPRSDDVIALHRECHIHFHKVNLVIINGEITFESSILSQVKERLKRI